MAMNGLSNINFGPAFGGFSAAEANNEELANLKMKRLQDMFQANQMAANTEYRDLESDRYRQETPYSVAQQRLKGNQADVMNTAPMIEEYRLGEVGKTQSSAAAGSKAKRTLESDVVSTNTTNIANTNYQNTLSAIDTGRRLLLNSPPGGAGTGMANINSGLAAIDPIELQRNPELAKVIDIIKSDPTNAGKILDELQKSAVQGMPKAAEKKFEQDVRFGYDKVLEGIRQAGANERANMTEKNNERRYMSDVLRSFDGQERSIRAAHTKNMAMAQAAGGLLEVSQMKSVVKSEHPEWDDKKQLAEAKRLIKKVQDKMVQQTADELKSVGIERDEHRELMRTPPKDREAVRERWAKKKGKVSTVPFNPADHDKNADDAGTTPIEEPLILNIPVPGKPSSIGYVK